MGKKVSELFDTLNSAMRQMAALDVGELSEVEQQNLELVLNRHMANAVHKLAQHILAVRRNKGGTD